MEEKLKLAKKDKAIIWVKRHKAQIGVGVLVVAGSIASVAIAVKTGHMPRLGDAHKSTCKGASSVVETVKKASAQGQPHRCREDRDRPRERPASLEPANQQAPRFQGDDDQRAMGLRTHRARQALRERHGQGNALWPHVLEYRVGRSSNPIHFYARRARTH